MPLKDELREGLNYKGQLKAGLHIMQGNFEVAIESSAGLASHFQGSILSQISVPGTHLGVSPSK